MERGQRCHGHPEGCRWQRDRSPEPPHSLHDPSTGTHLWARTRQRSRGGCSRVCRRAAGREKEHQPRAPFSSTSARPSPQLRGTGTSWAANLTSAWPPDVRVLLHFSHLKQGRCQSFPREVTFSAAMERRWVIWGAEQAQVSFGRLVALLSTLGRTFLGIFSGLCVQDRGHCVQSQAFTVHIQGHGSAAAVPRPGRARLNL